MKARLLVAAVGVPLILVVLCVLPPVATAALFIAVTVLGTYEIYHILHIEGRIGAMGLTMASGAAIQLLILLRGYEAVLPVFLPFGILLFLCWVAYYEKEQPFGLEGLAASLFSGVMVPLGLGAMTGLRLMENGHLLVLCPLMATFVGDSGCFFAGRALGKRKMSPRTSPNKTIAGLIGGLITAALGMLVFGLILRCFHVYGSLWKLTVIGLIGGGCAQLGDLSFSLIKRHTGAKDYGNLLPGHGGAYDRFDSTSFAAPVVLVLLRLMEVF